MAESRLITAIDALLAEDTERREAMYRLFQFLYWIYQGGEVESTFQEASKIYINVELARIANNNKRARLRFVIMHACKDPLLQRMLVDAEATDAFYPLLGYECMVLHPARWRKLFEDFDKIRDFFETVYRAKISGVDLSYNDISEARGSRTTNTAIRNYYGDAVLFIFAGMLFRKDFLVFAADATMTLIEPMRLLTMLDRKIKRRSDLLEFFATSKKLISVIDQDLSERLSGAWPNLVPAEISLPPLSPEEITQLLPLARHEASDARRRDRSAALQPGRKKRGPGRGGMD